MTTPIAPLPPPNTPIAGQGGAPSQAFALWFSTVQSFVTGLASSLGSYLTTSGGATLTGGFQETEVVLTPSGGAITPNPSTSLKQAVTNNAALTINATSQVGDVELHITNGASAGAVTFSGFDKQWTGDSLDTVNGHHFVVFIYGFNGKRVYIIKALQ